MMLTIKTDRPEAEVGLYENGRKITYLKWLAGRSLSSEIHEKIDELFKKQKTGFSGLKGVVLYKGPGSFTGLRIGAAVANTLAYELDIPISGASGEDWIENGLKSLKKQPDKRMVELEYGSAPKTTKPKK